MNLLTGSVKATWSSHDGLEGSGVNSADRCGWTWWLQAGVQTDAQTGVRRHVAVSTAVVTQQLVSKPSRKAPRARPCRVSTADRKVRKGIMAHSLEDLLGKVRHLPVPCKDSLQALAEG